MNADILDIEWPTIIINIRVVFIVWKIECCIQKVCDLEVRYYGDRQVLTFEQFCDVLPQPVKSAGR